MSGSGHVPIAYGGVALHQRVVASLHDLTATVVHQLAGQLPAYASLPLEELRGDISHVVEQCIRTFAEVLRTGELPDAEGMEVLRRSAALRAEEGIPVDAVISAYHLGAQVCADHLSPEAGPADLPAVVAAHGLLLRYLQRTTATVMSVYFSKRQAAPGGGPSARQALLTALLEADDIQGTASRSGIRLPPCYLVLSLSVAPHPDERTPGVSPLVATRRKLRRLSVELERHVPGAVLSALSGDGGLALIPYESETDRLSGKDWAWLDTVVSHMSRVCGAGIVAGASAARPQDVAGAALLAGEVRQVAAAAGRAPGVYRLPDVLLEYQLTRPGPARDALAELIRPLADRPELLETLRAFLGSGLSRRLTAERLSVHPNTVDYRLRRAAAVTGLDATSGPDLLRVQAALSAHDAARNGNAHKHGGAVSGE